MHRGAYLHINTMKNERIRKKLLEIFPDGHLPITGIIPTIIKVNGQEYFCYKVDEKRLTKHQREKLIQLYLEINRERGTPITREELEHKIRKYGWIIRSHGAIASDDNIFKYL